MVFDGSQIHFTSFEATKTSKLIGPTITQELNPEWAERLRIAQLQAIEDLMESKCFDPGCQNGVTTRNPDDSTLSFCDKCHQILHDEFMRYGATKLESGTLCLKIDKGGLYYSRGYWTWDDTTLPPVKTKRQLRCLLRGLGS
jgi:hypothetical protein